MVFDLNKKVDEVHYKVKLLEEAFISLETKEGKNEIYFNGQVYDAYSKLVDILNEANNEIIIIDSYGDKSVLDIISNVSKEVVLITTHKLLKNVDILKYNKQYSNLRVIYDNVFHDRYICLDKGKIYHLGASINHLGNKTFSINILEDEEVVNVLLNKINKII